MQRTMNGSECETTKIGEKKVSTEWICYRLGVWLRVRNRSQQWILSTMGKNHMDVMSISTQQMDDVTQNGGVCQLLSVVFTLPHFVS